MISVEWCSGTKILIIDHSRSLWRRITGRPAKKEAYRLIDGLWYDAYTFKPIPLGRSSRLERYKYRMQCLSWELGQIS